MPDGTFLLQPMIGLLALFGSVGVAGQAPAPAGPTVAVEVDATQAAPGETVTASVYIRNGTNIAGADVAVETGDCLRIVSQTPGDYLPTSGGGGFVVLDETTDNSSRLAVAIIDRSALANADGIFFEVEMDVVCDVGSEPIVVSFAELSAYVDPAAETVELVAYRQENGTLATTNADVKLVPAGGGPAPGATTSQPPATTDPPSPPPTTTGDNGGTPGGELPATGTGVTTMSVALGLLVVGLGLVVIALVRRRRPTTA